MDAALGRFDLTTRGGLLAFLSAQRDGIASLRKAAGPRETLAEQWAGAVADLDADLAGLGHDVPACAVKPPKPDHGLARRYVWHGSRVISRMLARRWAGVEDPAMQAARRYFERVQDRDSGRGLIDALEDHSARGREANAVTRAANDWFALFEHCAATAAAQSIMPVAPTEGGIDADA